MKKIYQLLIVLFFLTLSSNISAQKADHQNKDTLYVLDTDTIFNVDTLKVRKDPNSITLSKIQYDSLLNQLKNNETSKRTNIDEKKETHLTFFTESSISYGDYQHLCVQSDIEYKSNYILFSLGMNFNPSNPIIGGFGLGRRIIISPHIILSPDIISLWYYPLQSKYKIQNNNHLRLNVEYKFNKHWGIKLSPSIYFGWRNSVESNTAYNGIIHIISPYKPFYATETSSNSTFDIGFGFSIGIFYLE